MADVRTMKLNLLADVADFGRGLAKADNDVKGFSGNLKKYGKMAAGAFAAAAAAAGTYAIKLGIEGVQAAIEDEKSQKLLAKALQNTTNATDSQIAATEKYISTTQLRYGVSDVKLRTSLSNLARATGDVTKARSYFYSDSMNDLPLLEKVSHPIATNPDDRLRSEAQKRHWPILELFT